MSPPSFQQAVIFFKNVNNKMFKKPKRNFRTRKAQEDGSDAENDDSKEEKMEIAGETYIVQETAAELKTIQ